MSFNQIRLPRPSCAAVRALPYAGVALLTALGDAARQGEERAGAGPAPEAPAPQGITRHVGLLTGPQQDVRA
ncbi:MAG: hypothetical protein ACHP7G_09140, partial [Actinomycetales bacterium]